jgi:hypothetical protein
VDAAADADPAADTIPVDGPGAAGADVPASDLAADGPGGAPLDAPEDAPVPIPDAEPDGAPDLPGAEAPPPDTPPDTPPDAPAPPPDAALLANGAPCGAGGQCQSGFCADGVCCATACAGTCEVCNLGGSIGTCAPAPAGQDPHDNCDPEPVGTCGRDGQCNGARACRLHAPGTPCASQTCVGGAEVATSTCNGVGMCVAGAMRDCSPYACSAGACLASCSNAGQCKAGHWCNGGRCVPDGLVLHWSFDEPDGTVALDSSGSGYNGTYTGMTGMPTPSTLVPTLMFANPRSRAFVLAERHAVRLANMPAPLKPTRDVTLSVWYRATMVDTNGAELASAGDHYLLRVQNATMIELAKRVSNNMGGGTWVQCYAAVPAALDGAWHHVAGVNSAAGMKLYLDGVERCTNTEARDILYDLPTGTDFWVGRHGTDGAPWDFEGNIDEVRVYARALGPAEIAALAAGGP